MTSSPLTPPVPAGPVAPAARMVSPDLARGAALLLIALANAHLYLFGHGVGVRGYPPDPGPAERAVTLLQVLLVDGRAYPMFGALFGYGLVLLGRRAGAGAVARRCRWLIVLGFAHAALLFSGDILGAYGLLGLVFGGRIVVRSGRWLLRTSVVCLLGTALVGAALAAPVPPGQRAWLLSMTVDSPLTAVVVRVAEWVVIGLLQALGTASAVLLGGWAARRRVLEEPARHRRLLQRVVVVGLTVAIAGAIPLASMAAALWPDPSLPARLAAGGVHAVSGYGGGLAYAALAGLAALRLRHTGGLVTTALVACGQRSLTCYLAQSVVFVAVLAPYGGGWGDRIGLAGASALAVLTWAATVVGADLLRRAGHRGPAETWLRARTYSRAGMP